MVNVFSPLVSLLLQLSSIGGCWACLHPAEVSLHPTPLTVPQADSLQATGSQDVASESPDEPKPVALLDNDELTGWETIQFGGEGECRIKDGVLTLPAGDPLTGIASIRDDLPKTNYELSLSARRVRGIDFFCGLTFPVADSHCTLIVGGWSGCVVGLSNIDHQDASTNESRVFMKFEKERWYEIKVRVQPEKISVWIDGQQVIDQDIQGRHISLRNETVPTAPLGLCTFETTAEIKNLTLRRLRP